MSWKPTVALAVLLALAAGIYLLGRPATDREKVEETLLFRDWLADAITGIEIARPGEEPVVLERGYGPSAGWRILKPIDRPADAGVAQQMLWGIGRFSRAGALDPGRPEAAPAITGLDQPRLRVTFRSSGRSETLAFGAESPINRKAVFFRREGDPRVLSVSADVFDACNRTVAQLRSKSLVRYEPFRVTRLELEEKFTVARSREEKVVEYEKSAFERSDRGDERGWYLVQPWKERVDDMKVQRLTSDLAALLVEDFLPAGDPKAMGLDQPQVVVSLTPHGADKPITVQFGGTVEREPKKAFVYAHVVGSGEVGLVELRRFEELPRRRNQFRSHVIYPFAKDGLRTLSIEAPVLGRVAIERRETKKEGEPAPRVSWEVLEPPGLKAEPERVEHFVDGLLAHRLLTFLGPQPDLKLFGLDPADVTVAAETKEGRRHVFHFGHKGESSEGYLRREGVDEVLSVPAQLVKLLKRLELNFRTEAMFDVPRESLREFRFEARSRESLQPVAYAMKLDEKEKKWKFSDAAHAADEASPELVTGHLAFLNFIRAETFIARDPETEAYYKLTARQAPARLTVVYEGGPPGGAVLYVSEDLSDRPTNPKYYARFEGSPIVFEVRGLLIETLRRPPLKKPRP